MGVPGVLVLQPAFAEGRVVERILVRRQSFTTQRQHVVLVSDIRQVEIVRLRWELCRQSVHLLHDRPDTLRLSQLAHVLHGAADRLRNLFVAESHLLALQKQRSACSLEARDALEASQFLLHLANGEELGQEPTINLGDLMDILHRAPLLKCEGQIPKALGTGAQLTLRNLRLCPGGDVSDLGTIEASRVLIHHAHGLLDRFRKGAAYRHYFSNRFHLRPKSRAHGGKLVDVPSGSLHHNVIQCRLKASRCGTRDLVAQANEIVAQGDFCCDVS
mmetsp:Transcript_15385/g.33845  ORF Transcript_15385/g.33845 Transcript_15385/m.33845 type:complete len:274 (+) Transcript_15385:1796-2617(+)